jgi:hypothetical protein
MAFYGTQEPEKMFKRAWLWMAWRRILTSRKFELLMVKSDYPSCPDVMRYPARSRVSEWEMPSGKRTGGDCSLRDGLYDCSRDGDDERYVYRG